MINFSDAHGCVQATPKSPRSQRAPRQSPAITPKSPGAATPRTPRKGAVFD